VLGAMAVRAETARNASHRRWRRFRVICASDEIEHGMFLRVNGTPGRKNDRPRWPVVR
jgi:hypothetical protein